MCFMHVFYDRGIHVRALSTDALVIDAERPHPGPLVVTHAHADHVRGLGPHAGVVSTPQTRALVSAGNRVPHQSWREVEFGQRFDVADSVSAKLVSSGHILGSSQVVIEGDKTVVVSSDYLHQDHPLWKAPAIHPCDTLVVESTFGLPKYRFPPRAELFAQMATWCKEQLRHGKKVVLGGYALGKSQELCWFSNEFLGIAPAVPAKTAAFNAVYRNFGATVGDFGRLDDSAFSSDVLIVPSSWMKPEMLAAMRVSSKKPLATALCTGWHYRFPHIDRVFPLSDHADFEGLLSLAGSSQARDVYTTHGFDAPLAKAIHDRFSVRAMPLSSVSRHALPAFVNGG